MRNIAISLTILFSIIMVSCSLFLPEEDTTGPVIVIDSPMTSDVVSDTVLVLATATDENDVAGTELYIDDMATGLIDTLAPYEFKWITYSYENDSEHIIYVQGWDENDNYSNSDTILVTVDNASAHPAPIEDMDIVYQHIGNQVTWNMSDHERFVSYSLLRSLKPNMESSVSLFTSTGATDTTYFDSLANPLISYFYQVMIVDDMNYVSIGVIVESPSPEIYIPSGLTATVRDTSIRLRWFDNSDFETSFIIERDEGNGFREHVTIGMDTTEFVDVDLAFDREYRYRIAASYLGVNSGFSTAALVNSPLGFSPSNLEVDETPLTIMLRWDDNCIFESGFRVERDGGLGWEPLVELGANVTTYEDADLAYDTWYRYQVAAFTTGDQSSYSISSSIYSPLHFAPIDLAATADDTSIVLTWEDRCIFETGFIIQRGQGSVTTSSGYITIDSIGAHEGRGIATYTDFDIEEDAWYYYRVAAYLPDERSSYTSTSSIASPLNFAPSSLTATTVDTSIQLRWVDNCTFEDGFVLERDAGTGFEVLAELPTDVTSYLDSDMEYGILYHYRVAAISDGELSEFTWEASRISPLQFAPTSLYASDVGNSIQLIWNDNCIFEEGYILERNAGADYVQIANLGPNSTAYLDSDMSYGLVYRYRVAAYTSSGASSYSNSYSVNSPLGYTPSDVSLVSNDTSITISWTDECIFEEGFVIERDEGTGYIEIGSVGENITSFTDEDLAEDMYYRYRVAAFTSENRSEYSWSIGISSPIIFAPRQLFATAVSNTIVVRWTDYCIFEEGFIIERDAGQGFAEVGQVGTNTTNYIDTDMEYGIEYRYQVKAFTSEAESNYSNIATITSPLRFAPSGLFAFVNTSSIDLSWQDNCTFETGFHIERDNGSGFVLLTDVGADITTYSDADLVEGLIYRYRISAFTATLESDYSSIITVESPIAFAPINLFAVTQNNSIDLSWGDNCTFEEGFKVERDDGAGFVEIADLGANFTFYSDEDLEYYTIYRYRVAAYTATEQSNYTPIINVQSPVEIAPSNLVATAFDTEILLEWQDQSSVEEGFRIQRDDGSGFVQIAEVAEDVTEYTDYNVDYGTEYRYRVLAFANGQESDFTNVVTGSIAWLYTEWETIDAGTYTLGEAGYGTGVFEHTIPSDFEMMRYEVTNIQFAAFLEAAYVAGEIGLNVDEDAFIDGSNNTIYELLMTGSKIAFDGSAFTVVAGYGLTPAVGATWYGADMFADYYGWRLPTEEEWEVAARGDTEFDYPWGDTDPTCDQANFSGCSDELIPVGQTSGVSPFGLYDMVGNAWEWTDSFYDGANDSYVIKGGSWSNYTDNLKVWFRTEGAPAAAYNTIGFRCAR